ncbi:hypothetical protein FHW36_113115 [Chitinophaga polysaccharea]|uniref:NlpE-like protein n=1 Tax=Chitinophaga polysaccharea TaxID=1293035 RepID=A0A561P417_9BACT|nr:hypothetical protein [Chitinophaga polysaccharea]TWF32860.1 hypothetical protein FHW36_113115 [Chitinophaga polysaccharea]
MKLLAIFLILLSSGCALRANKVIGNYKSSCYINLYPNVILTIDSFHTFSYKLAYLDDKIEGTWVVRKDTLFLFSEWFNKKTTDRWEPIYKISDLDGMDAYLIKKNGLYMLSRKGVNKDCLLNRQSTSK